MPYAPQTTIATRRGGALAGTLSTGLPHLLVPGDTAEIVHGIAAAPESAPAAVQHIIWAANKIIGRPYVYGGGHQLVHLRRLRLLGHRLVRAARRAAC